MGQAIDFSKWNSLEIAKLLVAVLVPFTLWQVGTEATERLRCAAETRTRSENELAYTRARQQFLASQNLDITKHYLQSMRDSDFCKRGVQVRMMLVQGTSPVVEGLLEDFSRQCGISSDLNEQALLTQAMDESRQRQLKQIITGLEGPGRDAARVELRKAYEAAPNSLDAPLADAIRTNFRNYQITLGILVALGTVNDHWNGKAKIGAAVSELDHSPFTKDPTFQKWRTLVQNKRE